MTMREFTCGVGGSTASSNSVKRSAGCVEMIGPVEIALGLAAAGLAGAWVAAQPKPKPVPVRARRRR